MHFKSTIYMFGIAFVCILPQAVSGCSNVGEGPVSEGKATQQEYHEDRIDLILENEYLQKLANRNFLC